MEDTKLFYPKTSQSPSERVIKEEAKNATNGVGKGVTKEI
jgi:hypothetical protein